MNDSVSTRIYSDHLPPFSSGSRNINIGKRGYPDESEPKYIYSSLNTEAHHDQAFASYLMSPSPTPSPQHQRLCPEFEYRVPSHISQDTSLQVIKANPKTNDPSGIPSIGNDPSFIPIPPDAPTIANYPILRQPRLYPYTLTAQNGKASRSMIYRCLVPGCNQQFTRTDFRGKHLRIQHGLPIPKGCWAKAWILKAENYQYYLEAVAAQAHANSILSPWAREREVDLEWERKVGTSLVN